MRLHLPKALLAAVLAACLAWPAGATNYTASCSDTNTEIKCSSDGGNATVALTVPTAQDTITFAVSNGYLFNATSGTEAQHIIAANLVINQLNMTNGYSGNGTTAWYYFTGTVSGTGAITRTAAQQSQGFSFSGDMSEYSGDITINGKGGTPAEGKDYDNILKLGAIQVGKSGAAGSITINANSKLQLAGTTIWGGVTSVKTEIGEGNTTFKGTSSLTNVICSPSGSITNDGEMTLKGELRISAVNNTGTLTIASDSSIALGQLITFSSDRETGLIGADSSYTFTLATGDGTVSLGNNISYSFLGNELTTVVFDEGNKKGSLTIAESCYYIASGDSKTYAQATAETPGWIFVSKDATLSDLTGDTINSDNSRTSNIGTAIAGGGTISMNAGSGQVTIAADKLTDFTGRLLIESGRFNEIADGHVFSKVTVNNGGQFYINDGYNYTGDVSISGTGWNDSSDEAKDGVLRLGGGSTLSGKLTLDNDASIYVYTNNTGTLAGAVEAENRNVTVNGSGTLVFKGTGVLGTLNATSASITFAGSTTVGAVTATKVTLNGGGSLQISDSSAIGTLYSNGAGSLTIGDGVNSSITTVTRIELCDSDTAADTTDLTISENAVLKITGNNNGSDYKSASALLGEWKARTNATINGTLLAESAKLLSGDAGFTLTIGATGIVATQGIALSSWKPNESQQITILLNGGSLILGSGGFTKEKTAAGRTPILTSTGGVIGSYANTMTIASDVSLTSGTTTIDTSKYTIKADNTVTVSATDAPESTITINGIISGGGALKATGAGKLVLSTANTYTGGTTLDNGTIQASNNSALGTGSLTVNGNSGVIVDAANTLSVSAVEVTNNSTLSVSGKMSLTGEHALNIRTNAGVTIKESANLNLGNNKIWGAWEEADAASVISIEKNGSLQHRDFSYSGKEGGGSVTVNKSFGTEGYGCFSIATEDAAASNVTLEYSGTSAATVKAALTDVSITTAANAGKLTVSSETKTISALTAGSSVDITNAADLSIADVTIAAGQTVGVFSGATASSTPATNNEGTLTVTNLTANTGSTLNANLVLGGGTLTMNGTLAMGSTLTLSSGVTLSGDLLTGWTDRTQALTLFSGVDALTLGTGSASDEAITKEDGVDASTYFTNLGKGEFLLTYTGATGGGTVSLMNVPEPTTATLSLLALMGLAARRRRRKA